MMRAGILVPVRDDPYTCLARAAELGFMSGQLSIWNMALYQTQTAAQIRDACRELDFTITAVWCGWSGPVDWSYPGMYDTLGLVPAWLRARRVDELLQGASLAHEIGVDCVVTHLGYIPDNPLDSNRIGIVHAIRTIAREIGLHRQRFLFETGEELPLTLVQLIHDVGMDNLGVNFDPANLLINGRANPSDALDLLAPYVGGVHAKDAVYPTGVNPKGKEMPLGQGQANFPVLLRKLSKAGYQGDLTIERESTGGDEQTKDILAGKAYLEKIIMDMDQS